MKRLPRSIKQFLCHNLHVHVDLNHHGPFEDGSYQSWCHWCGWRKHYPLGYDGMLRARFMEWL